MAQWFPHASREVNRRIGHWRECIECAPRQGPRETLPLWVGPRKWPAARLCLCNTTPLKESDLPVAGSTALPEIDPVGRATFRVSLLALRLANLLSSAS